jgi:UDP-GlcNAc:undecaprenyl-phosphate GlcNAc-1-phosphate transferase
MLFYLYLLVFAFFFSFASIKILTPVAVKIGLTDKPTERKNHQGEIPLVGGISIYLGVLFTGLVIIIVEPVNPYLVKFVIYLFASLLMVSIGALDDRFYLSVRIRLVVQVIVASIMMFIADNAIFSLGNLSSFGDISLGYFAYPLTIITVLGIINAYNMVDGIDGLIGGVSFATFLPLAIVTYRTGDFYLAFFCLLFLVLLATYLLYNLQLTRFTGKKIFMGDAGSMFVGLTVVWLLAICTQEGPSARAAYFSPVVALWFVALPLMDMTAIVLRRIKRGDSPFKPDRDHLHHIFMRAGFSARKTLIIISTLALMLSMVGVFAITYSIPDWVQFVAFNMLFFIYSYVLSHLPELGETVRKVGGIMSL